MVKNDVWTRTTSLFFGYSCCSFADTDGHLFKNIAPSPDGSKMRMLAYNLLDLPALSSAGPSFLVTEAGHPSCVPFPHNTQRHTILYGHPPDGPAPKLQFKLYFSKSPRRRTWRSVTESLRYNLYESPASTGLLDHAQHTLWPARPYYRAWHWRHTTHCR
jgi:hypothetical protein